MEQKIEQQQSTYWIDKYKPKKIKDISCNLTAVKVICGWLKSFDTNKKIIESLNVKKEKDKDKSKDKKKDKDKDKDKEKNDENKTIDRKKLKSCIIITGSHGIGKTASIKAILDEYGYGIQTLELNNVKNVKNIANIIKKMLSSTDVFSIINGNKKRKWQLSSTK